MKRWKSRSALILLSVVFGGWYGFSTEQVAMEGAGSRPPTLRSVVRHAMTRTPAAAEHLNLLRNRAGHVGLTPAETTECWETIRSFTVGQVKDYLAELPVGERMRPANYILKSMLYYRWAQLDPEGAAESAEKGKLYTMSVMDAWADRDPDAVIQWAAHREELSWMVGKLCAVEDPQTALKRAHELGPRAFKTAVATLAGTMSGSGESRKEFFSMVQQNGHDSRAWDSAVSAMVGECIDRDPENALSQIDQFGLPPDQIDRVRAEMLKRFSSECPELALTWMQQHPDDSSSQTDSQQLSIYSNWARGYPDEANAWAVKNERPDFLASDVQKGVMNTLQSGWQPGDASNYWFSRLKGQFDAWQQLQPNETDVWLNGIPSTLRNDLTGKSNATH